MMDRRSLCAESYMKEKVTFTKWFIFRRRKREFIWTCRLKNRRASRELCNLCNSFKHIGSTK